MDETLRAKVREQYGDGSASPQALGRFQSGESFQKELDTTHQSLMTRRLGAIYRHARETVGAPPKEKGQPGSMRFKNGGNPVDYTGHVNYGAFDGKPCAPGPDVIRMPVVFDAKREGSALSYHSRTPSQKRQLLDLREAADAGAWSFLLVHCVAVQLVFVIHRPEYFSTLLSGKGIQLVEKSSRQPLLPAVSWGAYGWPWYAVLPADFGLKR